MKYPKIFSIVLSGVLLLTAVGCVQKPASDSREVLSAERGSASDSAAQAGGLEKREINPMPKGDKYMAITFDDGPTGNAGGRTERLLDGLRERNVHATFFLCGYRIKDFNSMAKRYRLEGHELGNHTMDHVRLDRDVSDGGLNQVSSNNDLIASYTGEKPTVMRPTGGAYNSTVLASMKQLGMPVILWNLDTLDWKYRDAESIRSRIVEQAEDGAIVLSHDLYETTVTGVLAAIDTLQAQGYAFVTVSELAQLKGVTLEPGVVYRDFTDQTLHPQQTQDTDSSSAA